MYNPKISQAVYDEVPEILNYTKYTKTIMDVIGYVRTMRSLADTGLIFRHSENFYIGKDGFTIYSEHLRELHDNNELVLKFSYGDSERRETPHDILVRKYAQILDYAVWHIDKPINNAVSNDILIGDTYVSTNDFHDELMEMSYEYDVLPLYEVLYKASRIEDIIGAYHVLNKPDKESGMGEHKTCRIPFKDGRCVDLELEAQLITIDQHRRQVTHTNGEDYYQYKMGYYNYFVLRDSEMNIIAKEFYKDVEELREKLIELI